MHLLGDLADASTTAIEALRGYIGHLQDTVAPRTRASFRLGAEPFAEKLRLDEGIDMPVARLLQIALRELEATKDEFERVAGKIREKPAEAWEHVKRRHPAAGELSGAVRGQLEELVTFIRRNRLVTIPDHEPLAVAPTPDFYRWTFASLWSPGAFEPKPLPAYYYITDVDPAWSTERQEEHLRDFNYATLWSVSIHEAFPGHFLHFEHLRQVESTVRKSTFFGPLSLVEGWAHYSEQLMFDQGFQRGDHEAKLGQLAEALVRLTRTVVGIRLHCDDLSVEQGVRLFREHAFLEEGSARREAERGTFDPSYVLYALGKQMMLKLRVDAETAAGDRFSLQAFHDTLLGRGTVPFWMLRELTLGPRNGTLLE